MKRLTLLRHAKSSWDDDRLADHERPLARRGLRDAPRMGERLAAQGVRPDLLLTSTAVRAQMTAELVAPALQLSNSRISTDGRIYLASPGELLEVLTAVHDSIDELIIVGHNPGMTQLANMLLPDLGLLNLPTAGAVGIETDASSWLELSSASHRLSFYDYPKNSSPAG